MRHKLEFSLFYLIWVATTLELVFCLSADVALQLVVTGLVALAATIAFMATTPCKDEVGGLLLKPLMVGMGVAIAVSAIVSGNPLMLCVLGPELLILLKVEGRYANEHTYES